MDLLGDVDTMLHVEALVRTGAALRGSSLVAEVNQKRSVCDESEKSNSSIHE
ncbi:hypothetical protein IOD13_12960 [Brevibacterium casei]|nr:hypothetical protein [Brevibacterium casei]